jgi:hypothetical protein
MILRASDHLLEGCGGPASQASEQFFAGLNLDPRSEVSVQAVRNFLVWKYSYGAPGEIRTPDPLVRSQMLYPSELRAHV